MTKQKPIHANINLCLLCMMMLIFINISSTQLTSLMDENDSLNMHFYEHMQNSKQSSPVFANQSMTHITNSRRSGVPDKMSEMLAAKAQAGQTAILIEQLPCEQITGPLLYLDGNTSLKQNEYLIEPPIDPG